MAIVVGAGIRCAKGARSMKVITASELAAVKQASKVTAAWIPTTRFSRQIFSFILWERIYPSIGQLPGRHFEIISICSLYVFQVIFDGVEVPGWSQKQARFVCWEPETA